MRGKVRLNPGVLRKGRAAFGLNGSYIHEDIFRGKCGILSECHSNIRFNIYITRASPE